MGPRLVQLLHHMLMLNDLFQLIRSVEKLHVLGHVDHIIDRVLLVHVLEMKPTGSAHLLKYVILHPRISDDLGIPEDSCDHFLNVQKTFLGKSDVNREC